MRVWKWQKIGWAVVGACAGFAFFAAFDLFGTWPVFRVARLTELTHIVFPKNTTLVSGLDHHMGPSKIVVAQVRMPYAAVSVFLHQPKMSATAPAEAEKIDPIVAGEFQKVGGNVADMQHLRSAWFSNGGYTKVWVDEEDPRTATVYLYYDEP